MAFDFPASPSTGTLYQPTGGPTYRYNGSVWSVIAGQFQGAMPSDAAPSNPVPGQLWWESDTGALFIYYDDGNTQQWVQISGPQPMPPNDGNEYVMRNGVWRLKSQTYDLAGKGTQDIVVPAWGPSEARISAYFYSSAGVTALMRISADGTTFEAGATNYSAGGLYSMSGSTGVARAPVATQAFWNLTSNSDTNPEIARYVDAVVGIVRSPAGYSRYHVRGGAFNSSAAYGIIQIFYDGWALTTGTAPLKALRWYLDTGTAASGKLTVEWLP
jgi:hypothetical protein